MKLPRHFVLPYHGPTNPRLPQERLRFRSETMTRTQGPHYFGDLMPIRALASGARHIHLEEKGS